MEYEHNCYEFSDERKTNRYLHKQVVIQLVLLRLIRTYFDCPLVFLLTRFHLLLAYRLSKQSLFSLVRAEQLVLLQLSALSVQRT